MKKYLLTLSLDLILSSANAILGPLPIYLNTEYRTDNPVIGSIASTIILDKTQIEATGANTFLGLLATLPSVGFVNPQGNVPSVFLRGNEARHTLVLVDGVKVHDISSTDGAAGHTLDSIPFEQIERIEIIKGPYSSLYGSSAIGGVIQVFTKNRQLDENGNLSIVVGSNSTKKYNFSISSGSKQGFININISQYITDGISALSHNNEKDSINNQTIGFSAGHNINKNTNIVFGFLTSEVDTEYDDAFGVFGTTPTYYKNNKLWHKALEKTKLMINHHFNKKIKTKLSLTEINQNRDSFTDGVSDGFNNKRYKTKDFTLLNDIKLDGALLNIGLSKINDVNNTDNQSLSSKDIFTQWQKNIHSFDVNTGIRVTNHSNFGNHITYNLSVGKFFSNGIKITSSYGVAFNAPSLFHLNGSQFTGGNPNLEPETSKNIELGIEKQYSWGLSGIRFFNNAVKNLIVYSNTATVDYFNEDELRIKGIELSVIASVQNYKLIFSHNYVDSQLKGSSTQQLRRPKNTISIKVSKQYDKFNSSLDIIKKSSSLDVGNVELDGYTLVNVGISYHYNKQTKLSLSVNNAFDKNYTVVNGYNQLGRTVNLGVSYNF